MASRKLDFGTETLWVRLIEYERVVALMSFFTKNEHQIVFTDEIEPLASLHL
jgi:hypothetical protein